jgi:integration host factor subunit beta
MTRADLIAKLTDQFPQLLQKDTDMSVRLILDELTKTLCNGGRIEIRGFGSCGLNYRPARNGRNPKTGAKVSVPARFAPHFKPGKELRERVDKN